MKIIGIAAVLLLVAVVVSGLAGGDMGWPHLKVGFAAALVALVLLPTSAKKKVSR